MRTTWARWAVFVAGALLVGFALSRSGDPPAARLLEHRFLAMGTEAVVKAEWPADRAGGFAACMEELEAAVRRVEKRMSRFDPESDVSRFNAAAPGEMVAVDPLTWMALTEAMRVHVLSGGAFDPTVLPLLRLYDWGNREARHFPGDDAVAAARAVVGMDKIVWEREGMRVGKRVAGVQLDLGGVAKGLGVDLAAGCLAARGVRNAVVDIGGEQRVLGRALA
ncbi:MAG: FAD:protein FMN transferase, partial [Planctomycetes bacterium]|nr:FAD:protein FMN transferase [Planctomycetota bacterium]